MNLPRCPAHTHIHIGVPQSWWKLSKVCTLHKFIPMVIFWFDMVLELYKMLPLQVATGWRIPGILCTTFVTRFESLFQNKNLRERQGKRNHHLSPHWNANASWHGDPCLEMNCDGKDQRLSVHMESHAFLPLFILYKNSISLIQKWNSGEREVNITQREKTKNDSHVKVMILIMSSSLVPSMGEQPDAQRSPRMQGGCVWKFENEFLRNLWMKWRPWSTSLHHFTTI